MNYNYPILLHDIKSAPIQANALSSSAADELKKFEDLLDDGIISQDEFKAKKKTVTQFLIVLYYRKPKYR